VGKLGFYLKLLSYKIKEWITAVKLERSYTKEEIIAMYLSEYDYIYGAHGVEAAALTYFGKPQSELNLQEAATLIGMLKNAVLYNPVRYPENALSRRNVVLMQMEKNDLLTEQELDSLRSLPMDISSFERKSHLTGVATYFRATLAEWIKDLIEDRELKNADGKLYNIYRDGLKVYTTLDVGMQKILESSVDKHMPQLQQKFFDHWKNRDIWTYKYDNIPSEIKLETLENQMRNTDRYRNIRSKMFGSKAEQVSEDYGFTLHDYDMDRLLKAEGDKDYLDRLKANELITSSKASSYRQLLDDQAWVELKTAWEAFQKEVDQQFNKKVNMEVFAYNSKGSKDTVMSPMDSLKYHRMILQVGSMAVDPKNGEVRAWVGGPDHKYFKYDHVISNRQVGSTFKPFLYATAIAYQGFSPCFPVTDVQYTIDVGEGNFGLIKPWTPKNATGEYTHENLSLYEALKQSKNTVSVFLMKQLGDTKPLLGLVDNMGIDSAEYLPNGRYKIPRQPSIALGAADLTVREMTGAYTTFANNGEYNKPVFVSHIEDRNGKVIYKSIPESKVALNEHVNYVMVELLRYSGAVARYKGDLRSDVGGKTGTTNDQTDAWFVGISPDIVVGTWTGGEDRWIRFRNIGLGQGSTMARPIFTEFMKQMEAHSGDFPDFDPTHRFYEPEDPKIETDCDEYNRQNEEESRRTFDFFGQ
jgi:penicillin-binding protein 1A